MVVRAGLAGPNLKVDGVDDEVTIGAVLAVEAVAWDAAGCRLLKTGDDDDKDGSCWGEGCSKCPPSARSSRAEASDGTGDDGGGFEGCMVTFSRVGCCSTTMKSTSLGTNPSANTSSL